MVKGIWLKLEKTREARLTFINLNLEIRVRAWLIKLSKVLQDAHSRAVLDVMRDRHNSGLRVDQSCRQKALHIDRSKSSMQNKLSPRCEAVSALQR